MGPLSRQAPVSPTLLALSRLLRHCHVDLWLVCSRRDGTLSIRQCWAPGSPGSTESETSALATHWDQGILKVTHDQVLP